MSQQTIHLEPENTNKSQINEPDYSLEGGTGRKVASRKSARAQKNINVSRQFLGVYQLVVDDHRLPTRRCEIDQLRIMIEEFKGNIHSDGPRSPLLAAPRKNDEYCRLYFALRDGLHEPPDAIDMADDIYAARRQAEQDGAKYEDKWICLVPQQRGPSISLLADRLHSIEKQFRQRLNKNLDLPYLSEHEDLLHEASLPEETCSILDRESTIGKTFFLRRQIARLLNEPLPDKKRLPANVNMEADTRHLRVRHDEDIDMPDVKYESDDAQLPTTGGKWKTLNEEIKPLGLTVNDPNLTKPKMASSHGGIRKPLTDAANARLHQERDAHVKQLSRSCKSRESANRFSSKIGVQASMGQVGTDPENLEKQRAMRVLAAKPCIERENPDIVFPALDRISAGEGVCRTPRGEGDFHCRSQQRSVPSLVGPLSHELKPEEGIPLSGKRRRAPTLKWIERDMTFFGKRK